MRHYLVLAGLSTLVHPSLDGFGLTKSAGGQIVYVPAPQTPSERQEILAVCLRCVLPPSRVDPQIQALAICRKTPAAPCVDLETISEHTEGFTGAMLSKVAVPVLSACSGVMCCC